MESLREMHGWIFAGHLFATFFMTGVIWLVQLVVYPSLRLIDTDSFPEKHSFYRVWTTIVVGPPMLVEIFAALYLAIYSPLDEIFFWWILFGVVFLIWILTAAFMVPLHEKLSQGRDLPAIGRLVRFNWLRTILWTARSAMLIAYLSQRTNFFL